MGVIGPTASKKTCGRALLSMSYTSTTFYARVELLGAKIRQSMEEGSLYARGRHCHLENERLDFGM